MFANGMGRMRTTLGKGGWQTGWDWLDGGVAILYAEFAVNVGGVYRVALEIRRYLLY